MADGVEKKEGEGPGTTEAAPATGPKPEQNGKAGETPSEEKKGEGAPDVATEQATPKEEKAGSAETESTTKAAIDNSPSSKAEDAPAKEEPKADVPAAVTDAAAATSPAAEDAAAKATTSPPTEAAESSQAEEKIGETHRQGTCQGLGGDGVGRSLQKGGENKKTLFGGNSKKAVQNSAK